MNAGTASPAQYRDINIITAEIRTIKEQTARMLLCSYVELGRRLTEAKELLHHGEWGAWLQDEAEFSQSTANNLMKIYQEYGAEQESLFGETNSQALGNLTYTKAVSLLKVPKEEREDFVLEHDVENISTRELDRLIKERDAAAKAREEAERERAETAKLLEGMKDKYTALSAAEKEHRDEAQAAVEARGRAEREKAAAEKTARTAEAKLAEAQRAAKDAEAALEALRQRPEIPEALIEKTRAEAAEEARREIGAERDLAERRAEEAERQARELKKQLAAANPVTAAFKLHFEAVQLEFEKLSGALAEIGAAEPGTAEKLKGAVRALAEKMLEALGK